MDAREGRRDLTYMMQRLNGTFSSKGKGAGNAGRGGRRSKKVILQMHEGQEEVNL